MLHLEEIQFPSYGFPFGFRYYYYYYYYYYCYCCCFFFCAIFENNKQLVDFPEVSLALKYSSQYSSQSQHCWVLDSLQRSMDIHFLQVLSDYSNGSDFDWCDCHVHFNIDILCSLESVGTFSGFRFPLLSIRRRLEQRIGLGSILDITNFDNQLNSRRCTCKKPWRNNIICLLLQGL